MPLDVTVSIAYLKDLHTPGLRYNSEMIQNDKALLTHQKNKINKKQNKTMKCQVEEDKKDTR